MVMELQEIINRLCVRYPNVLPTKEISYYELGKLQGQQMIIIYLTELMNKKTPK